MQASLGFGSDEISGWRTLLTRRYGRVIDLPRRAPVGQLVKSAISSRTRDAVSLGAYRRIGKRWGSAARLARAAPYEVEATIHDVTFADRKAKDLPAALTMIGRERPDFDLGFLGGLPIADALGWLERLPGVGRKTAAATLNFSTLARPVFVVDTHVHRVLRRLGFLGPHDDPAKGSTRVTEEAPAGWDAGAFLELFVLKKRLGQTLCRHEAPVCGTCPLAPVCATGRKRTG